MAKYKKSKISKVSIESIGAALILVLLTVCTVNIAHSQQTAQKSSDSILDVVTQKEPNQIKLYAFSQQVSEGEILMEVTGQNIKTIPSNPTWSKLSRGYGDPVVVIQLPDDGSTYTYNFNYKYHAGLAGGRPDLKYVYDVPLQPNQPSRICLGYGEASHGAGTIFQYSLDFAAAEGTPVCAARDGVVISYRSDSNVGGPGEEYTSSCNQITIRHADGSYGEYVHLKQNGVLVRSNQQVKKGQVIGLSGKTGRSTGPHLHFCVFYFDKDETRHSVPILMKTKSGITGNFYKGQLMQR